MRLLARRERGGLANHGESRAPMSRAASDVPADFDLESRGPGRLTVHSSQSDVVSEVEMHAEHVAALETTLFRRRKPTLVLSLEAGAFRVLSKSARPQPPES